MFPVIGKCPLGGNTTLKEEMLLSLTQSRVCVCVCMCVCGGGFCVCIDKHAYLYKASSFSSCLPRSMCEHAHACTCMCVCSGTCAPVYIWTLRSKVYIGGFLNCFPILLIIYLPIIFIFQSGSLYVVLAVQGMGISRVWYTTLTSNLEFTCLCLLSARTKGMCHHAWPPFTL